MTTHLAHAYDAHTHLHLDDTPEGARAAREALAGLRGAALMSTAPADWDAAAALARASGARCLFGIHPWLAHEHAGGAWLPALRERLRRTPGSAVGEIGLDRLWRPPGRERVEYEAQRELFVAQLDLAAELGLPASVHCVRAQGDLQDILRAAPRLPPTLYLHAFGGARGTVEQLTRARGYGERLYFGFAACVNLRSPKTREAIAAVPDDRLVVESDRASALGGEGEGAGEGACAGRVAEELTRMLALYAEVKGWAGGAAEAAVRTARNAERLYAPADLWVRSGD